MSDVRDDQGLGELEHSVSELHHRVKNNLQVMTSVISLQASRITDPQIRSVLRVTQNRVRAIAGVLGPYSTPDLSTVHFGQYLGHLIRELAAEYAISDRVQTDVRTADIAVDLDHAIALALIANELTANALEHAFPGDGRGKIGVSLSYGGVPMHGTSAMEHGELQISDDGVGLPAGLDFQTAESTGFYLVKALTTQLRAKISLDEHTRGTSFRVSFPLGTEESLRDCFQTSSILRNQSEDSGGR